MNRKARWSASIVACALFLLSSRAAGAGEPTDAIRNAINQGIEILKNAKLDDPQQRAQIIERLRKVVYPLFDFNEMAMRSLGPHWRRLSPEQRKEFVAAFTALLEKTYANQIDLYHGQQVIYTGETIEDDYAHVETRIIDKDGKSYSVVYRLHKTPQGWKIYDVVAENVSIVNNYRSQFNRVLAQSSFEELLQRMKQQGS